MLRQESAILAVDVTRFDGSRDRYTNALLYPGVWRRRWIQIPGTATWFCIGMELDR